MSLAGSLEDIGLGDIVQVVSLSRRSGIISLRDANREGEIVFRSGRVVRARSSDRHVAIGKILTDKGNLGAMVLQEALLAQKQEKHHEALGKLLVRRYTLSAADVEAAAQEQIERAVRALLEWKQGHFELDLFDDVGVIDGAALDPIPLLLERGFDPHHFMADEEDAHPPAEVQYAQAVNIEAAAVFTPIDFSRHIVLVDDDAAIIDVLAPYFRGKGFEVTACAKSEEALILLDDLYRNNVRPHVVIDLIMPRMDGSGILGGLELLELIHSNYPALKLAVMADYQNLEAERKVQGMGLPFLLKPRRGELNDNDACGNFGDRLFAGLELKEQETDRSGESLHDFEEPRRNTDEDIPAKVKGTADRGISLLRNVLRELNDPCLGEGITLLILRFAGEFLRRTLVFLVEDGKFRGVGQFGFDGDDASAQSVKKLCIPSGESSILADAVERRFPATVCPEDTPANRLLFSCLGGTPREIFIAPLMGEKGVVALLYGDNFPTGKPITDTDCLEIFILQAGHVVENNLERLLTETWGERI